MRYQFVAIDGRLCSVASFKVACLAALKAAYGLEVPAGAKAGVIRVHPDGRRYWCVVRAVARK